MSETTLPNKRGQCGWVLLHRVRHRLEAMRALSTRLELVKPVQYLLLHTAASRVVRLPSPAKPKFAAVASPQAADKRQQLPDADCEGITTVGSRDFELYLPHYRLIGVHSTRR